MGFEITVRYYSPGLAELGNKIKDLNYYMFLACVEASRTQNLIKGIVS